MPYYPKSQIQTDLFTKGKQLRIISSRDEYIGYYWKTSKGEYFSGRNPYDGSPIDLEPIPKLPQSTFNTIVYTEGNELYNYLKEVDVTQALLLPTYTKPSPTQKDYQIGNFIRYFAKKNNENIYIEIFQSKFEDLRKKNPNYDYKSYLIFSLQWQLTGEQSKVLSTNRNIVLLTEQNQKINGLGTYLKNDYLEFYNQKG